MFSTNKLIKKTINKQTNKNKKTREEIRKVESNDSPEIPDRRETSDIPGLPSGQRSETSEAADLGCYSSVMEGDVLPMLGISPEGGPKQVEISRCSKAHLANGWSDPGADDQLLQCNLQ